MFSSTFGQLSFFPVLQPLLSFMVVAFSNFSNLLKPLATSILFSSHLREKVAAVREERSPVECRQSYRPASVHTGPPSFPPHSKRGELTPINALPACSHGSLSPHPLLSPVLSTSTLSWLSQHLSMLTSLSSKKHKQNPSLTPCVPQLPPYISLGFHNCTS